MNQDKKISRASGSAHRANSKTHSRDSSFKQSSTNTKKQSSKAAQSSANTATSLPNHSIKSTMHRPKNRKTTSRMVIRQGRGKSAPSSPPSTSTTIASSPGSTMSTQASARSTTFCRARAELTSSAIQKISFNDTPHWKHKLLIHDPSIDMFNVNLKSPFQCWNVLIGNEHTYTLEEQIEFFSADNHDNRIEDVCNSFQDPGDLRTLYKATCSKVYKATGTNPLRTCTRWNKPTMCSEIIKLINENWDSLEDE